MSSVELFGLIGMTLTMLACPLACWLVALHGRRKLQYHKTQLNYAAERIVAFQQAVAAMNEQASALKSQVASLKALYAGREHQLQEAHKAISAALSTLMDIGAAWPGERAKAAAQGLREYLRPEKEAEHE